VTGFWHGRWLAGVVAALSGLACWHWLAGTAFEQAAFTRVLGDFAKPPIFIAGKGTHAAPWRVRVLSSKTKIDFHKAPMVVSLGDDPDGVFQASPPSPVDVAVVLKNLRRLGAQQVALGTVLAWETPDPVALKGLEMVLNDFQLVVHAVPLARGAIAQAMPAAVRRASLAQGAIHGDVAKLPIVNRVAVADVICGGGTTLAGFSVLDDAESGNGTLPLLARWQDEGRVVLAFPLLAVLARHALPVDGIQVKLGEFLQLGPAGPVIPIDRYGGMSLPIKPVASRADVTAEALIDGTPDMFQAAPEWIMLRDDQTRAPRATREFSATLTAAIAAIESDAGLGQSITYRRLAVAWEAALILALALLSALLMGLPRFQRLLGFGSLAAACVAAQWLAVGMAQLWLPGIPLLAALVAAIIVSLVGAGPVAAPAAPAPANLAAPAAFATRRVFRSVTMRKEPTGPPD
jgi:hypothetical protein